MAVSGSTPNMDKCELCGKPFQRRARKRFCSECAPIHRATTIQKWAKDNPEKNREKSQRYYYRHPEKVAECKARYKAEHHDRMLAYSRSEHRRHLVREWEKARRESDPGYVLSKRVAHGIRLAIKSRKAGRQWEQMVGYTLRDLMRHIERQFAPGMSWENHGSVWHIDHIQPVSAFEFSSVEEASFRECWALSNLRPLWAEENMSKFNKRMYLI
jgi:uncharacterized Zn finger protein (UPF0148 family)